MTAVGTNTLLVIIKELLWKYVMRCAIWYYLYNLKNKKNTHGGVLILVTLLRLTLLYGCFSRFLNCTNGTKSHNAPHIEPKLFTHTIFTVPPIETSVACTSVRCCTVTILTARSTNSWNAICKTISCDCI